MSRLLRRLLSESAIYGLGAAASQIVGIILIPIYARELGPPDYGVLAVMNTTISLSSMVAGFALAQAFFRRYLAEAMTDDDRAHLVAVSLTIRLVLSGGAALLLLAAAAPLGVLLVGERGPTLILLVAPILLLDTINVIPLSYLRSERRPRTYMLVAFLRAVLGSVLIVALVVWAGMGVEGALIGSAISAAVTTLVGLAVLAANGRLRLGWDAGLARELLTFAAPLVPAAAAGWALNFADRYIVLGIAGESALGVYAAGYSIGLVINVLVVQPFSLMWAPMKWEIHRDERDARRVFGRVMTAYTVAACLPALVVSALATDVIRLLLTDAFEAARFVVPFTAFAYVLYGAYALTATGMTIAARTVQVAATVAAAAVLNAVLNFALVPGLGFMGAAIATLASYGFLAVAAARGSERHYPVDWELRPVAIAFVAAFGLSLLAAFGPDHVAWRIGAVVAYPVLLVALRIVRPDDVRRFVEAG